MQSNKPWTPFDYFFGVMQVTFLFAFVGPILGGVFTCLSLSGFLNIFAILVGCMMGIPPFIVAGLLTALSAILLYRCFPLAPKALIAIWLGAIITPLIWLPTIGLWTGQGVMEVLASSPNKLAVHSTVAAVISGGICSALGWSFLVGPERA